MAFKGHVTLDGNDYILINKPTKTFVNQMAPPIGQGESKYQDGTSWAAWIQRDWQDGNGKLDPLETEGFLYGEVESRVPRQLILPGNFFQVDTRDIDGTTADARLMPEDAAGYWTFDVTGSGSNYHQAYIPFKTPASVPSGSDTLMGRVTFWVYASVPDLIGLTFTIFNNSAGAPNAAVIAADNEIYFYPNGATGPQWYGVEIDCSGLSTNTTYWLRVYTQATAPSTFRLYYHTSGYDTATYLSASNVSSPAVATGKYALLSTSFHALGSRARGVSGSGFFRFNNQLYCFITYKLYRYDTVNDQWDVVSDITDHQSVTGATVYNSVVYFGNGGITTTDYTTMLPNESMVSTGVNGHLFFNYQGLLYRAYGNELEYSDNGADWEPTLTYGAPITVGSPDYDITGLAGLNGAVYAATPQGLYQITDGDFAKPIEEWGGIDPYNGSSMVAFQGALYITANGRVVRFTEDQRFQDVWMSRDDDMLSSIIGRVWHLERMNNWLLAIVGGGNDNTSTGYNPTIWALQGNSWHHIAALPSVVDSLSGADVGVGINYRLFYDRPGQSLWAITPSRVTYRMYIPDFTLNPFNDTNYKFQHTAWVEWDWFDGNIFEILKDYESITIIGENLSATCYVEVYWKDDDSTDWEYLGIATSNVSELRWDIDRGDRPATRRFKMAMLLTSTDGDQTPRVRAIRVKYLPMLRDWFSWNLSVDVAGTTAYRQEGVSREVNTRTGATIYSELEALAKATGIFLYTDIDGQQYEVKIKSANFAYTKFEYNEAQSAKEWEGVWNITLEQVTTDPYTP